MDVTFSSVTGVMMSQNWTAIISDSKTLKCKPDNGNYCLFYF